MKQRNLNTVFANISKTIWLTSDSFLLIMSQLIKINTTTNIYTYVSAFLVLIPNEVIKFNNFDIL